MNKQTNKADNRMRRYIRITDESMWEKIDKIMEEPGYSKSFNKVINDALYFGLDELMRQLFEKEEVVEAERLVETNYIRRVDGVNEAYFLEIAKLLKELLINVTINKSLLSSLFNAKLRELNGESVSGKKFSEGRYAGTPEYQISYEVRGLRDLRN